MKTGLVFSGGGARGAYQIGAWRALEELGIKCDIVTGTSIGSINGAMYVTENLELAEEMWKKLSFKSVFSEDFDYQNEEDHRKVIKKYLKSAKNGGIEPNNLRDNIAKCLDLDKFYKSNIDYGLTTVTFPKFKAVKLTKKEIEKDKLIDYILASATVFPFFKVREINEGKYIDGGFKDPIPIDVAINLGAEKLIVINIGYFRFNAKIDKKYLKEYDITVIKPNNNIGTPLTFDSRMAQKIMKYGYNDTMKVFKKLYGKSYTFKRISEDYQDNSYFKNEKEYINTIEYLGKIFKLDDTKIYTISKYNQELKKCFAEVDYKEVKRGKDIRKELTKKERIKYIYTLIANEETRKISRIKKQYPKEYLASYYLYNNLRETKEKQIQK